MRVQIVSFHCVLKNNLGQLISSSFNQDVVTTPTADDPPMLPEFIEALRALKIGERRKIAIPADRAYGFYDPNLVVTKRRKNLRDGFSLKAGDFVKACFETRGELKNYVVESCDGLDVVLNGNHPLAGQDLVFDIEMVSSHEETEPPVPAGHEHDSSLLC